MRVGIVGMGMVGKEVLLNLYYFSSVQEIIIYDLNQDRVKAEINDFEDTRAVAFGQSNTKLICATGYDDLDDCQFIIINVAAKTDGKMSDRIAALADNENLMRLIAPEIAKYSPNAIVLITSNPVDAITYFFLKHSGFNPMKVIGSGTLLDTSRLLLFLAQHYGVHESSIQAWVLGEHGKTSFIPWSLVNIAGAPLPACEQSLGLKPVDKDAILQHVIDRGPEIFNIRGYTDHGIGACVLRIFNAIAQNEATVLPVTCPMQGQYGIKDIHVGSLAILGENGIHHILETPLTDAEISAYHASANSLKDAIRGLEN
ncbi:MAG: malate dehydrogenase [Spirochaetia bacterium]